MSPDGLLLFTVRTRPGSDSLDIWGLRPIGDRKPFPIIASADANEYNGVFSPDGRWIAYQRSEGTRRSQIYVQSFPARGAAMRLTITAGGFPRWSADGRQVFYCGADSLSAVNVSSPGDPGVPQDLFSWPWFNLWVIDSKGERFLRPVATEATEPITVVLNWTAALRKN